MIPANIHASSSGTLSRLLETHQSTSSSRKRSSPICNHIFLIPFFHLPLGYPMPRKTSPGFVFSVHSWRSFLPTSWPRYLRGYLFSHRSSYLYFFGSSLHLPPPVSGFLLYMCVYIPIPARIVFSERWLHLKYTHIYFFFVTCPLGSGTPSSVAASTLALTQFIRAVLWPSVISGPLFSRVSMVSSLLRSPVLFRLLASEVATSTVLVPAFTTLQLVF